MKKYILPRYRTIDIAPTNMLTDSKVDVQFNTNVNNNYDNRETVDLYAKEQNLSGW